jgi:energy-coupling factor transporter ATP-binding protein EcfA2
MPRNCLTAGRAGSGWPVHTGNVRPVLCPVMVGRDQEVSHLRNALAEAAAGRGRTVLLAGEAGIGKSRLARELSGLARERDFVVLTGRAVAGAVPAPFRPFAEALAPAVRPGVLPAAAGLDPFRPALGRPFPEWRADAAGDESLVFLGEAVLHSVPCVPIAAACSCWRTAWTLAPWPRWPRPAWGRNACRRPRSLSWPSAPRASRSWSRRCSPTCSGTGCSWNWTAAGRPPGPSWRACRPPSLARSKPASRQPTRIPSGSSAPLPSSAAGSNGRCWARWPACRKMPCSRPCAAE